MNNAIYYTIIYYYFFVDDVFLCVTHKLHAHVGCSVFEADLAIHSLLTIIHKQKQI